MKRLLIILIMFICTIQATAQRGLHVNELFEGHIINQERMVEIQVRGKAISKYGLTFFRSLRFKASKEEAHHIETIIMKDVDEQTASTLKRIGNLSTGLNVQLPPQGLTKRLLCYKYAAKEVLIIYLEGPDAVPETLGKLIK
ncbi:MAG: hypothetical protein IJV27_02155 [Prevotella sp.]|nr:hypothetical protein [Prevotella sp.]